MVVGAVTHNVPLAIVRTIASFGRSGKDHFRPWERERKYLFCNFYRYIFLLLYSSANVEHQYILVRKWFWPTRLRRTRGLLMVNSRVHFSGICQLFAALRITFRHGATMNILEQKIDHEQLESNGSVRPLQTKLCGLGFGYKRAYSEKAMPPS